MNTNLYPLTSYPICKDYIWGGTNLFKWGKNSDKDIIAESWEFSGNSNGESVISNGIYKDTNFNQLIKQLDKKLLGNTYEEKPFPILIKFIDAKENLSVQVHPNDEYAHKFENLPFGKNEMWYILECEPNSFIYYGLKNGTTKEYLQNAIQNGTIESLLNKLPVKKGDTIYIPAGTVHAITKGITLLEIQQNSDITYRLYDYNRKGKDGKPRELHIDKALDVINYNTPNKNTPQTKINLGNNNYYQNLLTTEYFTVQYFHIENIEPLISNQSHFETYTVIDGKGNLTSKDSNMEIAKGQTILIPAYLGEYTLSGNMNLIKVLP